METVMKRMRRNYLTEMMQRRIALCPVARNHFELRDQSLQHEIFRQCALKLGEQAVALSESGRS